jgi:hypothetical protein
MSIVTFAAIVGASAIGLRLWLMDHIEAAIARPVICMNDRDVGRFRSGRVDMAERDRLVASEVNGSLHRGTTSSTWHLRGASLRIGYALLFSATERRALSARHMKNMRLCPRATGRLAQPS